MSAAQEFNFGHGKKKGDCAEASRPKVSSMLDNMTDKRVLRKEARVFFPDESAEAWFKSRVDRGGSGSFAEIVTVTPDIARVFLGQNGMNRVPSRTNLERLVAEIEGGRWNLNGETIIVSSDGSLNDGQHRCFAVVETGKAIKSWVVFGATRESRFTTDQGNVRDIGALATMRGVENGNAAATVASYIWHYIQTGALPRSFKGGTGSIRPTRTQLLNVIETHDDIAASVKDTPCNLPGGRALGAFCIWALRRKLGDKSTFAITEFFDGLKTGAGLAEGSPILKARNMLLEKDARRTPHERAQILFAAWNAYREGRKVKIIRADGKTKLPALEK